MNPITCMSPCPPAPPACTLNWFPSPCICMVTVTAASATTTQGGEHHHEPAHHSRRKSESAA